MEKEEVLMQVSIDLKCVSLSQKVYFELVVLPEIKNVLAKYDKDLIDLGKVEK